MKVGELVEKLLELDQKMEVVGYFDWTAEDITEVGTEFFPDGCPCCPPVKKALLR